MKKKVAFFVNGLYGGGAEKVLQTLLRFLDYGKYDVTLYSVIQEKYGDEYPANIDYKFIYGASEGKNAFARFLTLCRNKIGLWIYDHCSPSLFYQLFVKGKYDVEVAFIEGYATRIVSGSNNPDSKKIAWVHIDLESNHWTTVCYKSDREECICYQKFDKVIGVSKSVKNIDDKLFAPLKSSTYIYNPIDFESIKRMAEEPIEQFNTTPSSLSLVSCGRLVPQKGFDRLIEVTSQLINEGYNIKIIIIGEGEQRGVLENLIYKYHLENNVSLLGYQSNPFKYYKHADWFICSSRAEGFSLALLESMSVGLPVISTNCSGPNEIIGNSEYGVLVENSIDGLYQGVRDALCNKHDKSFFIMKSNARVKDFELTSIMSQIENVL